MPDERRGLPLVAVPTTAGTGAETNGFAVLADPTTHAKLYLGAASVRPRISILDLDAKDALLDTALGVRQTDARQHQGQDK